MIKINVIITCFRHPKNVTRILSIIRKNSYIADFNFTIAIYDKAMKSLLPKNINCIILNNDFFWAESVKFLINYSKNEECDYFLHINEDLILDKIAFNKFVLFIRKKTIDIFFGVVRNIDDGEIIFGQVMYEYYFKPRVIKSDYLDMKSGDSFHGNFFAFKKEALVLFDEIPKYTQSYLDFHFSLLAKRKGLSISTIPMAIGFTKEDSLLRKKFVKFNHGIFSKSRSNLFDKYRFFKFKCGFIVAIFICIGQLIKLKNL
jgi:GT2 family glycosyltransferase